MEFPKCLLEGVPASSTESTFTPKYYPCTYVISLTWRWEDNKGKFDLITPLHKSKELYLPGRRKGGQRDIKPRRTQGGMIPSKMSGVTWEGIWIPLGTWEWFLVESQQGNWDLSPVSTFWILPPTWMSLKVNSFTEFHMAAKSSQHLDFSFEHEFIQAHQDLQNCELMFGCWIKPLRFC